MNGEQWILSDNDNHPQVNQNNQSLPEWSQYDATGALLPDGIMYNTHDGKLYQHNPQNIGPTVPYPFHSKAELDAYYNQSTKQYKQDRYVKTNPDGKPIADTRFYYDTQTGKIVQKSGENYLETNIDPHTLLPPFSGEKQESLLERAEDAVVGEIRKVTDTLRQEFTEVKDLLKSEVQKAEDFASREVQWFRDEIVKGENYLHDELIQVEGLVKSEIPKIHDILYPPGDTYDPHLIIVAIATVLSGVMAYLSDTDVISSVLFAGANGGLVYLILKYIPDDMFGKIQTRYVQDFKVLVAALVACLVLNFWQGKGFSINMAFIRKLILTSLVNIFAVYAGNEIESIISWIPFFSAKTKEEYLLTTAVVLAILGFIAVKVAPYLALVA